MDLANPPSNLFDARDLLQRTGVQEGMQVGDFGTGGAATFALTAARMIGVKARVFAVDILKPALSAAMGKARLAGLRNVVPVWSNLEIFNATKLIRDQALDVGTLVNLLHQSKNPEAVLKECTRMLKVGGKLLIVEWRRTLPGMGPRPDKLMMLEQVEQLAGGADLVRRQAFEPGPYHWAAVFERVR